MKNKWLNVIRDILIIEGVLLLMEFVIIIANLLYLYLR